MCSPAAADSCQPGRRGRRDWSPPRFGPTPADPPHPPAPGLTGVRPRLGVSGPGCGCARPSCRRPDRPAAAPSLQHHPACPSRFASCLAACRTYPLPAPGTTFTHRACLSLLSQLTPTISTDTCSPPSGTSHGPSRAGVLVSQAQPALIPSCSFPFSLGSQSLLCDFSSCPGSQNMLIHSFGIPLLRSPFVSLWWMWPRSSVSVGHPGSRCLRFCGREGRTAPSAATFPLPDLFWSGLWAHQAQDPGPRTEMTLPIKGHFGTLSCLD